MMQYLPAHKIADKFPSNVTEDFIKLLCDQGRIDHSRIPSHDGRKSDVYMIPECEINTIRMLLYGDDAIAEKEKEKEEEKKVNTVVQAEPKKVEEYYSTDDVMKLFGFKNKQRVYSMANYRHIERVTGKGYPKSEIDAVAENYTTREKPTVQNKPSEEIVAVEEPVNNDDILALEKRIKELTEENEKWKRTVYDLKLANERLKETKTTKPDMTEWKAAYKEGFFDCIKFANAAKEFLS